MGKRDLEAAELPPAKRRSTRERKIPDRMVDMSSKSQHKQQQPQQIKQQHQPQTKQQKQQKKQQAPKPLDLFRSEFFRRACRDSYMLNEA